MELAFMAFSRYQCLSDSMRERFEPNIRSHLLHVYLGLLMILSSVLLGAQLKYLQLMNMGLLAIGFALIILIMLQYQFSDSIPSILLLAALGICVGQALANNFELIYGLTRKNIVYSTILGTSAAFMYLTLSAMMAVEGSCIDLNRSLLFFVYSRCILCLVSFIDNSFNVEMLMLYSTVLITIVFVLSDTQHIMTAYRGGSRKVLQHSLGLSVDAIIMFRSLAYIVMQKQLRRAFIEYHKIVA